MRAIYLSAFSSILILISTGPAQAEADTLNPQQLVEECITPTPTVQQQSNVTIDVTSRQHPPRNFRYHRVKTPQRLALTPIVPGDPAYERVSGTSRLVDNEQHQPATAAQRSRWHWLFSEELIEFGEISDYQLTLDSHYTMGKVDYYNITAVAKDPAATYRKRSLSLKRSALESCRLIRAAYYDREDNLRKKLFLQWQNVNGIRVLKTAHIEDVHTLDSVKYTVENVRLKRRADNLTSTP